MSWFTLHSPAPCAEKQRRVDKVVADVGVALRDLRRTLVHAEASRDYHFDPVLSAINDGLKGK